MISKLKTVLTAAFMGVTVVTVLLLWASAYSAHIPPQQLKWCGILGMAFPVFAVINALCLIIWLLVKPRLVIVPFIGFLCCMSDLRTYCPVNIPIPPRQGCIKIMSYNAQNFDGTEKESPEKAAIVSNILNSDADIVCIQEGDYWADWGKVEKKLRRIYKYMDVLGSDSIPTTMRCFSKFEITGARQIPFPESFNSTVAFYFKLPQGDTIIVLSNHLQSDNLTAAELSSYHSLVKGDNPRNGKTEFLSLMRKIAYATQKRAQQVDSVAAFINRNADTPMIVCGDFNDTPISYARREIARNLTDAYASTGLGPGFSYNSNGMHVRIDHMMCSKHWKPYKAQVVNAAKGSDHYPITAFFRLKSK